MSGLLDEEKQTSTLVLGDVRQGSGAHGYGVHVIRNMYTCPVFADCRLPRRDRRTFPPACCGPLWSFSPSPCGWLVLPLSSSPEVGSYPVVGCLVSSQTSEALFPGTNVVNVVPFRNSENVVSFVLPCFAFQERCERATFSRDNAPAGDQCWKLGRAGFGLRV